MTEPISAVPASVVVETGANGKKIYRIESEFVIEGRVQKPTAFYIITRLNPDYQLSQLTQGFLYKIEESVEEKLF